MTSFQEIHYEVSDRVLTITFAREEQRNTVTYAVLDELLVAFADAELDDEIRAIVVTAQGRYFSAGTDLLSGTSDGGYDVNASDFKPLRGGHRDIGGELALRIFDSNKPVIAAINGTAVGIGVTMILPMDIRIASDSARFGLPFTRRGIVPESCATWFLPRVVGISRAVEWSVTGRIFEAAEALEAGLVRELLPAAEVLPRALAIAGEIATQTAPVPVALTRQMLWRSLGEPHPLSANRLESQALLALGTAPDAKEGVAAFRQKRQANFSASPQTDMPDFHPWWTDEEF